MSQVYEPSRSLGAKVARRITPFLARRPLGFKLARPLVSFTFDDCPLSAIENGVKPLEREGWQSTVYVAGSLFGQSNHHGLQISAQDCKALHHAGHEIGGHSWSHIDAQSKDIDAFIKDVERNQEALDELGLPPSPTFAYPYGQTTPQLKRRLEPVFEGMRGITPGLHRGSADLNQIKSIPLFSGPPMQAAFKYLRQSAEQPAWLTFFTHDIRPDHSYWGCAPEEFTAVINAVKEMGADVMSLAAAINFLKESS